MKRLFLRLVILAVFIAVILFWGSKTKREPLSKKLNENMIQFCDVTDFFLNLDVEYAIAWNSDANHRVIHIVKNGRPESVYITQDDVIASIELLFEKCKFQSIFRGNGYVFFQLSSDLDHSQGLLYSNTLIAPDTFEYSGATYKVEQTDFENFFLYSATCH